MYAGPLDGARGAHFGVLAPGPRRTTIPNHPNDNTNHPNLLRLAIGAPNATSPDEQKSNSNCLWKHHRDATRRGASPRSVASRWCFQSSFHVPGARKRFGLFVLLFG